MGCSFLTRLESRPFFLVVPDFTPLDLAQRGHPPPTDSLGDTRLSEVSLADIQQVSQRFFTPVSQVFWQAPNLLRLTFVQFHCPRAVKKKTKVNNCPGVGLLLRCRCERSRWTWCYHRRRLPSANSRASHNLSSTTDPASRDTKSQRETSTTWKSSYSTWTWRTLSCADI